MFPFFCSASLYVFLLFFVFPCFLPLLFFPLLLLTNGKQLQFENGEFHSNPVCTDPVQNFLTHFEITEFFLLISFCRAGQTFLFGGRHFLGAWLFQTRLFPFSIFSWKRSFALICALLRSLAPFCAHVRSFADLHLDSFAIICFCFFYVFLRPSALGTTKFGNFRDPLPKKTMDRTHSLEKHLLNSTNQEIGFLQQVGVEIPSGSRI